MEGVPRYQAISFLRMAQAFVFSIVPFSSILIRFSHSPASMSKLNSASFKVTKNLSGYIYSLEKYSQTWQKERFDKELVGIKEPFPVTNWPITS